MGRLLRECSSRFWRAPDRLPSACRSELCVSQDTRNVTHDQRIGAGNSILTAGNRQETRQHFVVKSVRFQRSLFNTDLYRYREARISSLGRCTRGNEYSQPIAVLLQALCRVGHIL